jgi:hypothetical protein
MHAAFLCIEQIERKSVFTTYLLRHFFYIFLLIRNRIEKSILRVQKMIRFFIFQAEMTDPRVREQDNTTLLSPNTENSISMDTSG